MIGRRLYQRPVLYRLKVAFIRSVSATPVVPRALNPRDASSSSSLTSTNVSLLRSLPPEASAFRCLASVRSTPDLSHNVENFTLHFKENDSRLSRARYATRMPKDDPRQVGR